MEHCSDPAFKLVPDSIVQAVGNSYIPHFFPVKKPSFAQWFYKTYLPGYY